MKKKKLLLVALWCLWCFTLVAVPLCVAWGSPTLDVQSGNQMTVPRTQYVTDVLSTAEGLAADCSIKEGGTVTVVAVQGSQVLLRYTRSDHPENFECADGTQFIYPKVLFADMPEAHRQNLARQEDDRRLIEHAREGR